ncbi:prepilin-type N-terminal cleavage/methylation domain-containing protein [Hydrogenimonas sp.]
MRARGEAAFTLVELLVVLLLMGIVYALAFSSMMPKSEKEAASEVTLPTIASLFRASALYRRSEMALYCREDGRCQLVSGGETLEEIKLPQSGRAYIINPDETLQSLEYPHVRIGTDEFRPAFRIRCRADGLFDPQIIRQGDRWLYLHPFGEVHTFTDPVSMVSFVRQSDYLPDRAGYAQ